MVPPAGSTTAQGLELQMGTNCLGRLSIHAVFASCSEEDGLDGSAGGRESDVGGVFRR